MKILLTTLNSKYIHSSLSIRYLKSFCEDIYPEIQIKEYTINQNTNFIAGEIYKANVDIVAFSCYIWNIESTLEIAESLKQVKPDIKIILGGPEVSFDGCNIFKEHNYIDFIIYGEGEETFKELLIELDSNRKEFGNIQGIIYRESNKVVKTLPRPLICNLDDIPSPFKGDFSEYENKIVYFESSRGCPFNCKFCLSSTIKGVRYFSIERIKSDLKKLIEARVKQVKFVDRTFNAKKEYALEIMKFIIKGTRNYDGNINFHFEVTAHLLDEEILNFLKNVPEGLFQFEIGVQSTNPKTIESINRNTDIEKLKTVVQRIKKYNNIHQHLDLIAGLPYENYNTLKKSFNEVYNMKPDKLQLGFLKLLKGSDLREDREKHGFKFINKPPYEVIENDYIKYKDMLKLKTIEDLVEKYGNEENFRNSTEFIINSFYNSSFDFYEDFSVYWEGKKYHTRSHSQKNLYKILYEFFREKIGKKLEIFNEVIKFDFLYNNKNPNLPKYINESNGKQIQKKRHDFLKEEENIENYLYSYKGESVKDIIKDIHFQEFNIDILELINRDFKMTNDMKTSIILLFIYDMKKALNKCEVINITKDFLITKEGEI